jgi:hypothetical protein
MARPIDHAIAVTVVFWDLEVARAMGSHLQILADHAHQEDRDNVGQHDRHDATG